MKAGEPDPHTCPIPALARRAHTGEGMEEKGRMAWRKGPSLFSDGEEQRMQVWALQLGLLYSKAMAD